MAFPFRLSVLVSAALVLLSPSAQAETINVSRVRDLSHPATTVKDWLAQVEAATVQVTGVKLNRTDTGLEITLETAEGKPLQVDATKFRTEGNSLVADIPNAVLALTEVQAFTAENPTQEIASVQVVQQDVNSIRVRVTGTNALPKQEVTLKAAGLAYSLNPEAEEPDEEIVVTGEQNRYCKQCVTVLSRCATVQRGLKPGCLLTGGG
mgnify:CR=1 FL=1